MASERWPLFRRKVISDDEFIELVRKKILRRERWRPWAVGLAAAYVLALIALTILGVFAVAKVGQLGRNWLSAGCWSVLWSDS
jgi:hypothetical protein